MSAEDDRGGSDPVEDLLTVTRRFDTFEDWWAPFELGVGPAGDHVATLAATDRESLRGALRDRMGEEPFELGASAWFVVGRVGFFMTSTVRSVRFKVNSFPGQIVHRVPVLANQENAGPRIGKSPRIAPRASGLN